MTKAGLDGFPHMGARPFELSPAGGKYDAWQMTPKTNAGDQHGHMLIGYHLGPG